MYGLGNRIGFYLKWFTGDLASWIARSEVNGIRLTNSVFIAATFLAIVIRTSLNVSKLQVVEVYIILLLTFGYYLVFCASVQLALTYWIQSCWIHSDSLMFRWAKSIAY